MYVFDDAADEEIAPVLVPVLAGAAKMKTIEKK